MAGTRYFWFALLTTTLLLSSCRRKDTESDTGPAVDTSAPDADAGMSASDPALIALTRGISTAAALAGPLVAEGQMLRDDTRAEMPGTERRTTAQERLENGISGNSIVTDPACVAFDWNLIRVIVTVTFTGCIMEATGESLDGQIVLDVNFGPTEFILTFNSLMIAEVGLDGEVGLRLGGTCGDADPECVTCPDGDTACAEMQANQRTMWAAVSFSLGEDFNIVLTDMQLDNDGLGSTVSGAGTITSPSFSGTFTANALRWNVMECLPAAGSLVYSPAAGPQATATMLATTPTDGVVSLEVPPLPVVPYPLFTPCP
jgi:hypothetical protein